MIASKKQPQSPSGLACDSAASQVSCLGAEAEPSGNYFVAAYPPFSLWSSDQSHLAQTALNSEPDPDVPLGLYVHLPFCLARCDYCFYLSYANSSEAQRRDYVDCLLAEWTTYARSFRLCGRPLRFVYFGGGTPSLLGAVEVERLLKGLQAISDWTRAEEVTFECAPRSVDEELIRVLRDAGVTRLSLGIQSWNDAVLRASKRVHDSAQSSRAFEIIRKVRFPVVNLDLIAGLPEDDEGSFLATVDRTVAMRPECVTIYQLETPYYTPLSRRLRQGSTMPSLPVWDLRRAWAGLGFQRLEAAGYTVRSAYAAVLDSRRHRFVYQDQQYRGADLIGIGASAFSYCHGTHFQNLTSLEKYRSAVDDGRLPIERAYTLSRQEQLVREFVLQLKLGHVDPKSLSDKFHSPIPVEWHSTCGELADRGWLECDGDQVRLTRAGLLRADAIVREFYLPRHRGVRYT